MASGNKKLKKFQKNIWPDNCFSEIKICIILGILAKMRFLRLSSIKNFIEIRYY